MKNKKIKIKNKQNKQPIQKPDENARTDRDESDQDRNEKEQRSEDAPSV